LSNATKFTDAGHVTFRVESVESLAVPANHHRFRFQVQDSGIGIEPDKLTKIFLPFEQAGKKERNREGTGLGLAISQQIVEKMESQIQVESRLGEGSCFWFELDLCLAADWVTEPTLDHQMIIGYQGKPQKILVVDDREENRLVVINMLEPLGFEVLEAENADDCLAILSKIRPNLIITDIQMGGMDGLTLTRHLRQLSEFIDLPIIASPATISNVDRQASLDAGCNSFLPKPLELSDLLNEIENLLQLKWIYQTVMPTTQETNSSETDWLFPPAAELVTLYEAAQSGFMGDVQQEAHRLKHLDAKYAPLANHILDMSQKFDDEGILKLIAPWL
jgi:CheY-like chemotaxis protein